MDLISKEEAKIINQKWYFTGIICQNGHIDKRYVNTGICYACKRKQNSLDFNNHKERVLKSGNESYKKYRKERLKTNLLWAKNNRERSNQIKRKNAIKFHDKYLAADKKYQKEKRKNDPLFRMSKNMSKAIWSWMNGSKNYRHWETFVDYNKEELFDHLEKQFYDGMTWENYGSYWHIDHVKPKSWFKLESDFKEVWKLSNLQPMLASENLSKNNKYEGKHIKRISECSR